MTLALYGLLVILALFIVLMAFNPNLSCFGRKLKSPFYPVTRKRKMKQKKRETIDYGFNLGGPGDKKPQGARTQKQAPTESPSRRPSIATEDYGFDLGGKSREKNQAD
ncbi:MAG: hypothetical protein JSV17_05635 [Candidatus Aminicenantes bacterium]|nr:MAG: hypothetical protein JSV17_05635 [Candidatus Aminicenantes bacterium]